jgi:hypothetical protein
MVDPIIKAYRKATLNRWLALTYEEKKIFLRLLCEVEMQDLLEDIKEFQKEIMEDEYVILDRRYTDEGVHEEYLTFSGTYLKVTDYQKMQEWKDAARKK